MASESMYKHLWIPKRTARDWGKTEYRIIRNWTPREPKQTNNQSDQSRNQSDQSPPRPAPATGQGPGTGSHVAGDLLDDIEDQGLPDNELQAAETSPSLTATSSLRSLQRGSEGRSNIGAGREVELEQNEDNDEDNETRLLRGRKRRRAGSPVEGEGKRSAGGSVVKRARLRHSLYAGSETEEEGGGGGGGQGGEGGGEGRGKEVTNTLSGTDHTHGGEVDQIFERSLRSDKRKDLNSSSQSSTERDRSLQPPHVGEKRRLHSEPARLGGDMSGEDGVPGGSELLSEGEPETTVQQKKTSRGKGKRKASKTTSFKLWQSHYQRSGRDLNELDICFTLYDSAVRDAIDEEADPLVQSALVRHWRLTKRHILSTIRDLSVVSALEKKYQQELTKHRKLQKESLAMLRTLRQVNGHYLEAASRAQSARETHKLSVEQSEIEELSLEISSYAAKLNTRQ